jgi:hypothetical protein
MLPLKVQLSLVNLELAGWVVAAFTKYISSACLHRFRTTTEIHIGNADFPSLTFTFRLPESAEKNPRLHDGFAGVVLARTGRLVR